MKKGVELMEELLSVKNLALRQAVPEDSEELIQDVSFSLHAGRPLTLIGESGCGKSLVGQAVLGIIPRDMASQGEIIYNDFDLLSDRKAARKLWGREVFLFPQEPGRYLNPLVRSLSQVSEVFRSIYRDNKSTARQRGAGMMEKVNLGVDDQKKYPWQLSGGMGQRLLTAISLALPARVIVADEPTKGLDSQMKQQTVTMLKQVSDSEKGLLVITHDLEIPKLIGGDIAVMYGGRIVEYGPAERILDNPGHPYTIALHDALPENGLKPIARQINGNRGDSGCVFANRCMAAQEPCFKAHPPGIIPIPDRHRVACYQKICC